MNTHAWLIVLVCAGVTIALRALPFVCFGGKDGMPGWVASLGSMLPPQTPPEGHSPSDSLLRFAAV